MQYPTAHHYKHSSVDRILKIFRHIQGNSFNSEKALKILELAKNSIYSGKTKDARAVAIKSSIRLLKIYQEELSILEEEILGSIFSYRKDATAYKVSLEKEIDKLKIGVAYVFTDMKDNKSNDQEIDLIGSYQFTKNLKLDLLHAIIDGSEDYSRAKADSETRIKVSYSF